MMDPKQRHQAPGFWDLWGTSLPLRWSIKAKLRRLALFWDCILRTAPTAKRKATPEGGFLFNLIRLEANQLTAGFALLYEGVLGSAGERLAFRAHGLGGAAIGHALLHERGLGSTRERLAVLADCLAVTALLRKSRATGKCDDQTRQHDFSKHFVSPGKC